MEKIKWKDITHLTHAPSEKKDSKKFKFKNFFLPLFLAIFVSFAQFFIFHSCIPSKEKEVTKNIFAIAVAKKNLAPGEVITEKNTKLIYMDIGQSKDLFILNSELNQFLGHKILSYTKENTPLLKNALIQESEKKRLVEKIPPGKRLFALETDLGPLNSLLHIGDKVDIIAHLNLPEFGKVTENILEAVEVIGIGDDLEGSEKTSSSHSLSFYVSAEEVKILSFMKQYAHFSIALRNPNDLFSKSGTPITLNKFIQDERIQKIIKSDSFQIIK